MRLNILFSITAVYLTIMGLGFIFFPEQIGRGAVPPDSPPALIAYLRVFGAPLLGIAVLNWTARNATQSRTLDSIILGNIVGFGVGPMTDVWGITHGARSLAVVFLTLHLLISLAFVWAWRTARNG